MQATPRGCVQKAYQIQLGPAELARSANKLIKGPVQLVGSALTAKPDWQGFTGALQSKSEK
jgi:hypothetical protein